MVVMNALRRAARSRLLAPVLLRPGVRSRLASVLAHRFLLAARLTTTPVTFVRRELTQGGRVGRYTLRASGRPILITHGRDLEAFYELFSHGEYAPPGELAARLSAERVRSVLDVGANVGMFSLWAHERWPSARITALEPDPENLAILERTLDHCLGQERGAVVVLPAAAGGRTGRMSIVSRGGGSFVVPADPELPSIDMVDVFPLLGECDFAKIDIEGGEWAILGDPRLGQCRDLVIAMEYHRHNAPSLPALDAARALLRAAGFEVGHEKPNEWGHGVLWAWK